MLHSISKLFAAALLSGMLVACGGGGEGIGGNNGPPSPQALQAEINQLFPFTPNQPFTVTFSCARTNSRLTYYFDFDANGTFAVYIELDNYQQVSFDGTYSYAGGAIRMVANPNNILMLDETTTRIVPHLGLVGEFETPNMQCGGFGHAYNDVATDTFKSYNCPIINVGAASEEDNAFEFVHSANPFGITVRGSVFRQRDIIIYQANNNAVTRGYGMFRRVGSTFYADFGGRFGDYNLLKGTFANGDQQLTVEQLHPEAGACTRR
jgi:hypothetical protein